MAGWMDWENHRGEEWACGEEQGWEDWMPFALLRIEGIGIDTCTDRLNGRVWDIPIKSRPKKFQEQGGAES